MSEYARHFRVIKRNGEKFWDFSGHPPEIISRQRWTVEEGVSVANFGRLVWQYRYSTRFFLTARLSVLYRLGNVPAYIAFYFSHRPSREAVPVVEPDIQGSAATHSPSSKGADG